MNSWAMASDNLRRCIAQCATPCVVLRSRARVVRHGTSQERGTVRCSQMRFLQPVRAWQLGFRWLHILAGITWIGLLYFFNFVQVPAFAAFGDEAKARNIAIDKVTRKALWWFRWAAVSHVRHRHHDHRRHQGLLQPNDFGKTGKRPRRSASACCSARS